MQRGVWPNFLYSNGLGRYGTIGTIKNNNLPEKCNSVKIEDRFEIRYYGKSNSDIRHVSYKRRLKIYLVEKFCLSIRIKSDQKPKMPLKKCEKDRIVAGRCINLDHIIRRCH